VEPEKYTYCYNCGTPCNKHYCPACGQRSSVYKVTFRETLQDLADQLFSLSAPLPQTLIMLLVNPGLLFRDYLSGKRKRYYKPISFFLLTTLIYLLIRWIVGTEGLGQVIGDPLIDTNLLDKARDFMVQNINNLLFIFVVLLALAIKAFYSKNYSLAEYLAVSFYLVGFYTLLTTLNLFYIRYIDQSIQYLAMLVMGVYFMYAMVTFLPLRKWLTAIKALLAFIVAYALYVFLAFNLSYLIILLGQ